MTPPPLPHPSLQPGGSNHGYHQTFWPWRPPRELAGWGEQTEYRLRQHEHLAAELQALQASWIPHLNDQLQELQERLTKAEASMKDKTGAAPTSAIVRLLELLASPNGKLIIAGVIMLATAIATGKVPSFAEIGLGK